MVDKECGEKKKGLPDSEELGTQRKVKVSVLSERIREDRKRSSFKTV